MGLSQISSPGIPISFTENLSKRVPTIEIPAPNVMALENEDNDNAYKGRPYRYAVQIDVNIRPIKRWIMGNVDNDLRVWRLRISNLMGQKLCVVLQFFWLPSNGSLYIYNSDKTKLLGAYTNLNNHEKVAFANEIIEDSELTLEYVQKGGGNLLFKLINYLMFIEQLTKIEV